MMTLTDTDLNQIRTIMQEALAPLRSEINEAVERGFHPLKGEIMALRNEVKKNYKMLKKA